MFVVDCPGHGARTVLSVSSITAIDQHDGIIDVRLRCWCGSSVVHRTGRNAHPAGRGRRQDGTAIAY